MKISADEIASVIQAELEEFESQIDVREVGTVLEVGDGGLHHLGRLEHKRELHLPRSEQLAHLPHPREQELIDDVKRVVLLQGLVQVGSQTRALTAQIAARQCRRPR